MGKFRFSKEVQTLKNIGKCLKEGELILSPFDQPVEEERRADTDQSDDNSNFSGLDNICETAEYIPEYKKNVKNSIHKKRFRFFLDGSIRTKYVGEYVEGGLSFPLIASEIAVAAMEKANTKIEPHSINKRIYFVFPHKDSNLISDTTYDRLEDMQNNLIKNKSVIRIEFLKKSNVERDIRTSLLGKVRSIMHDMEHEMATNLTSQKSDGWLIMDGAIRKQEFIHLDNTIGLAKSFSRKPVFMIGKNPVTLPSYMSKLAEGERSAVFKNSNSSDPVQNKVLFWYLRLRTFPPMEPLGGIVKIDIKILDHNKGLLDLVDEISAELYEMRLPSVYPWPRWPGYVYPIRLCEVYMTSSFLGNFVLTQYGNEMKNAIGR